MSVSYIDRYHHLLPIQLGTIDTYHLGWLPFLLLPRPLCCRLHIPPAAHLAQPHPKCRQDRFQFAVTQTECPADHGEWFHVLTLLGMADPCWLMSEGSLTTGAFVLVYFYRLDAGPFDLPDFLTPTLKGFSTTIWTFLWSCGFISLDLSKLKHKGQRGLLRIMSRKTLPCNKPSFSFQNQPLL